MGHKGFLIDAWESSRSRMLDFRRGTRHNVCTDRQGDFPCTFSFSRRWPRCLLRLYRQAPSPSRLSASRWSSATTAIKRSHGSHTLRTAPIGQSISIYFWLSPRTSPYLRGRTCRPFRAGLASSRHSLVLFFPRGGCRAVFAERARPGAHLGQEVHERACQRILLEPIMNVHAALLAPDQPRVLQDR